MAEVLGVAASVIAVAQVSGQVAKLVYKVAKIREHIQDVPEEVSDLVHFLELLSSTLLDIDRMFLRKDIPSEALNNSAAKASLEYCQNACRTLMDIAIKLDDSIISKKGFRRKIATVKVALVKDTLQRLEKGIDRSLQLLRMSMSLYNMQVKL